MLKASSLLYAIYVCLIVGLLSGSLLLIFNYQFRLKQQFFQEERLVTMSENDCLRIIDQYSENLLANQGIIESGLSEFSTQYVIGKWGFYDLLKAKTFFKGDTIYKTMMVGGRAAKNPIALYLTDLDQPLHIGGKTKIIGDVKISKYGAKPAYINNQNYVGSKLVHGGVGRSGKRLPLLQHIEKENTDVKTTVRYLGEVLDQPIYNSFFKPTMVVNVNGSYAISNLNLSGNIILRSNDSVHIEKTALLKDILIEAPVVSFAKDYEGIVQVFASKRVFLGERAKLKYPSSIYIDYGNEDEKVEVYMESHSKIAGGIVLNGGSYQSNLPRLITLEDKAEVMGDVYCRGKVQLKGKVTGTVYTNEFYLKTDASIYNNYIVDGEIDAKALPENFIGLPLFIEENLKYETIKEL